MKKLVLILTQEGKPFAPNAEQHSVQILQRAGLTVESLCETDERVSELLPDTSFLIIRSNKVPAGMIDRAANLELIVRAGAGYDNVDIEHATSKNVYVMNTPGQNATAVAELVFSLIHSAVRPINGKPGTELKNKKFGILGFGNIGKQVAMIAKGYGMMVEVYDRFESSDTALRHGVVFAESTVEVFRDKDYMSLHIPSTRETRGVVSRECLTAMSPGAVLVNTARVDVVDHEALITHLQTDPSFKYLSDVDQKTDILQSLMPNRQVVIPPKKMGAQTVEANFNAAHAAAQQIIDFMQKGITRFAVNNPVPPELTLYTDLATSLGRFCTAYVPKPREVQYTCYGALNAYHDTFIQYILKGLFEQGGLGKTMTPVEAVSLAEEHSIDLKRRNPDDRKGYGLAITLGFVDENTRVEVRGTIVGCEPEISRVNNFKTRIPLREAIYVLVETTDHPGVEYKIAQNIVDAGYNRSDLGYSTVPNARMGMAFYIVDKGGALNKSLVHELSKVVSKIGEMEPVSKATIINLSEEV